MNFDFGEILTRAFQITWKHKVLWLFGTLPMLFSFLLFPFMFLPIIFMENGSFNTPFFVEYPIYILVFILLVIVSMFAGYVLYAVSASAISLSVLRVEGGTESFSFGDLFNESKKYWGRILGVFLLIIFGVWLVSSIVFGCMAVLGLVTAGIGFICLQPITLIMYPLMLVLYAVMEEAQAAVVVDELGVADSIRRGWELVRDNFWRMLLISLVVYLGLGIIGSIISMPLMVPFFFIPFLMDSHTLNFDTRTIFLITGVLSLVMMPLIAFVQGIGITFLKSTYTLAYIRLTKSTGETPVIIETNA